MEYAIVDIETTGGHASAGAITEIAIRILDGKGVTERFETLICPCRPIPAFIQSMTGITDEMVAESPLFEDVARRIFELLEGRVFVAHNVNFDYSFVRHQLQLAGYRLRVKRLCTVRLSRKIRPGLPSYSLGRLCQTLGIPLTDRHRAGGDADATAILFARLLEWDKEGHVRQMLRAGTGEQQLPPNLPREVFEKLPALPGVYYFRDRQGRVIYVGKAGNLRKRVGTHFTGHNPGAQRQHFLREICHVDFEICATELMALILEEAEIRRYWPPYNKALKRFAPRFGLYLFEDQNGYLRLVAGEHRNNQPALYLFGDLAGARDIIFELVRRFTLCPRLCRVDNCTAAACSCRQTGDAPGAYNRRVEQAVAYMQEQLPSYRILDKGRRVGEQSCIWIEKGRLYGMGYIDRDTQLEDPEDIRSSLTRYESSAYIMQVIAGFVAREPAKIVFSDKQDR